MRPEERECSDQQLDHEFRGDPDIREAGKVVSRAVRLERGEALRRALVALLAGLQAIGRIDL
jgi:hypothetical protein